MFCKNKTTKKVRKTGKYPCNKKQGENPLTLTKLSAKITVLFMRYEIQSIFIYF